MGTIRPLHTLVRVVALALCFSGTDAHPVWREQRLPSGRTSRTHQAHPIFEGLRKTT